ncbi:MAG: four helix bundle protein [Bacteroidales bacterium]|nr:four helix bundle protein [Bacteroidales bacterium]
MISRFEEIIAWKKAISLGKDIYSMFDGSGDYGFLDQIHRAVVSISNNIAEGFERKTNNEFKQFLYISKGSCGEVRSMIYLAKELEMINEEQMTDVVKRTEEISKMLSGLIKTL